MQRHDIEERNARITHTMLGIEDHGIFTYFVYLDYGGTSQGFGGYTLDTPDTATGAREGTAFGCDAILQLLLTLGVDRWEKLPGTPCRVRAEHSKVHAIGHYLNYKWLDLSLLADSYRDEVTA